jgi:hypothetical protein
MPGALRRVGRIAFRIRIAGAVAAAGWFGFAYGAQETGTVVPGSSAKAGHSRAETAEPAQPWTTPARRKELRAEIVKRIEAIDAAGAAGGDTTAKAGVPDAKPVEDPKALRDLLKTQLDWMSEYEKAEQDYRQAAGANPEQDVVKAKAELERLNALLVQAAQSPDVLLPQAFRGPAGVVGDAVRTEMKDAIESSRNELKDWTTKYETAKTDAAKTAEVRTAMRAERDKLFQRVAALKARGSERPPPPPDMKASDKAAQTPSPASPQLDQERRRNAEWETQVQSLRLKAQEARIALEPKLTALGELELQLGQAHVRLVQKALDQMQRRFRSASDLQERDLKRAAASEESRAANSDDPLVRYRARRNADLLELEAQTVKFEQRLTSNNSPSLEEQRALTNRARKDFEDVKQLLSDGEVSRLDAILLNNDFRRIDPERDRIERNELKTVEARVQFYGNALTEAELELIEDARQDQFEHEALLERLPAERRPAAGAVFEEIEDRHRAILIRRRDALKLLANRATETLHEVRARLAVLDAVYGFIRTNIFWVRDQEPIGPESVGQGGREVARLGKAVFRIVEEAVDSRNWSRASAEFTAAALGLVVLPFGLFRLRRELRGRIANHLPDLGVAEAPDPTPDPGSCPSPPQQAEPD